MILRLLAALALLTAAASAQTKTVNKTISNNGLTENLVVPSGKTLTIASGATIAAAEGSTITGFTANAVWGGITGTLSAQTDLQSALDLKAPLASPTFTGTVTIPSGASISGYLTTATAASTYQPLDSDLTAIAAVTTTTFGCNLLTLAGQTNLRALVAPYLLDEEVMFGQGDVSVSAAGFVGFGAEIIGLNASNISSGTLNIARLADASITNAKLANSSITLNGSAISLGGSVTTATLGANTFTALQQFTGTDHAGLQLNNLTTTQRDALTGSAGMVIWNTTAGRMQLHNGTSWSAGMVRLDGDTMTGVLTLPAGTVSAPALTFGDSTTGIYRSASNEIAITNSGTQRFRTTTSGAVVTGTFTIGSGAITDLGGGQLSITSAGHYAFSSGFSATGLLRVSTSGNAGGNYAQWSALAAHTAIQRDSTNAQAFYVANTYTSTTSYEAAGIRWSSNAAIFGPVKGSGGGSSRNASYHTTETGVNWSSGSGSPEGVLTAPIGSLYTRTDGGASTTLYVKESGTGNTGWIAK
jgi:hypothetical protein